MYGDRDDLAALTAECNKYGVDIYADGVINHMGAGDINQFKDSWDSTNFHSPCDISNYCNHDEVRICKLDGLNDLATQTEPVRAKVQNNFLSSKCIVM